MIRKLPYPACTDCIWYSRSTQINSAVLHRCRLPRAVHSFVEGFSKLDGSIRPAEEERSFGGACGFEARNFKHKGPLIGRERLRQRLRKQVIDEAAAAVHRMR